MTTIGVVSSYLDLKDGTGVAKYGEKLIAGLGRSKFEWKSIHSSNPHIPLGKAINHTLLLPIRVLLVGKGVDLYHAMNPVDSLVLPFLKAKSVVTYHEISFLTCKSCGGAPYVRAAAPLFYRAGILCDRIVAVSELTKSDLINDLKIPEAKITVIHPGVDDHFSKLPGFKRAEHYHDSYVIGYVGTLLRKKRLDYLLRAFWFLRKKYPRIKVRLMIVGPTGNNYERVFGMCSALGISEFVEITGFTHNLNELYNSMDVFAFPSEWEGFGLPILEAQRCGVPVIVRAEAHLPHETTRFCIAAASSEDMADKMYELCIDESLKKRVVKDAFSHSKMFSWDTMTSKLCKLYEEVCDSN